MHMAMTLRFSSTTNFTGAQTISWSNLLDTMFVAATTTTAYRVWDMVRLKRVTIRAGGMAPPDASTTSTCTVGVEFPSASAGQIGSGVQKQDTCMGQDGVAYVSLAPDPRSQAAQWQVSTNATAFVLRAFTGANGAPIFRAIVDVEVEFKNSIDILPTTIASAPAGASAGEFYYGGLDGARAASTTWGTLFGPVL